MRDSHQAGGGSSERVVDVVEARFQARQAEALAAALLRTLERAARAVDGDEPAVRDVAGLAVLDARALLNRVHGLRRRTEQLR